MGDRTGIEWCEATWNPIRGCSRVSEGCRHCYAEHEAARWSKPGQPYDGIARMARRFAEPATATTRPVEMSYVEARWTGEVQLVPHLLDRPLHWRKPRRIFVNSMSDLFHEKVETGWLDRIFAIMALCPQHRFLILTKRPERMREYLSDERRAYEIKLELRSRAEDIACGHATPSGALDARICRGDYAELFRFGAGWPLPNVWLGVSIEDQATADARIPLLLETPAAVRFVAAEPLLGPVTIACLGMAAACPTDPLTPLRLAAAVAPLQVERFVTLELPCIDWLICGGESGPGARPMHPDWPRALRDQCQAAGVPFFFKQWGEFCPGEAIAHQPGYFAYQNDGWGNGPLPGQAGELQGADPARLVFDRVGKSRAGRLLDGREHNEAPAP